MLKVSIIIPCYNHGEFLQKAIESALNQKGNFEKEVIVVNDGSTDSNTLDVLDYLEENLPIKIIHQLNLGLAKARNNGIKASTGIFILPLDSDNYLPLDFIQRNIDTFCQEPRAAIVYSDRIVFGASHWYSKRIKVGYFDLSKIILQNYIDACLMYKREVFTRLNGYDENMPVMGVEDWDFNIRASLEGFSLVYNSDNYFYYRDVPNSMIKKADSKRVISIMYLLEKHTELYKKQIPAITSELSYAQRKPFFYFLKKKLSFLNSK